MIVAVFRARVREGCAEEYSQKADEMAAIASQLPGFISYKTYMAADGESVSIHEWGSAEHLKAWREHPEHRKMQAYGRDHFYQEYTLYVADSPRESRFDATARTKG